MSPWPVWVTTQLSFMGEVGHSRGKHEDDAAYPGNQLSGRTQGTSCQIDWKGPSWWDRSSWWPEVESWWALSPCRADQ